MEEVVARLLVVGRADAAARMNGVPPVVIVVRGTTVPAPIVRLERVVCPAHTGVLDADDDSGAIETEGPNARRFDLIHTGLDYIRIDRAVRFDHRHRVEGVLSDRRLVSLEPIRGIVRLDDLYVSSRGEGVDHGAVARGNDHIRSPERLVGRRLSL